MAKIRRHYWQFLVTDEGIPVPNAIVEVYKQGGVELMNIFDSPNTANQIPISPQGTVVTANNGYFEFWVQTNTTGTVASSYDYTEGTRGCLKWSGSGIEAGQIDDVDVTSSSIGPQGFQGTQGNQGVSGIKGPTGPQGYQGDLGGPTGPTGVTGHMPYINISGTVTLYGTGQVANVTGYNTPTGVDLTFYIPHGVTGAQGPQGEPNGPAGPAGEKGDQGDFTVIQVNPSVNNPAYGSQASVISIGSDTLKTLTFTVPQGPKGDKGDPGSKLGNYTNLSSSSVNPITAGQPILTASGGSGGSYYYLILCTFTFDHWTVNEMHDSFTLWANDTQTDTQIAKYSFFDPDLAVTGQSFIKKVTASFSYLYAPNNSNTFTFTLKNAIETKLSAGYTSSLIVTKFTEKG